MRRRRGFGVAELVIGLALLTMTLIAIVGLFIGGLRTYYRSSAKVEISEKNAQGLQQISDVLRDAVTVSVSSDGMTLTYALPQKASTADSITGEREYLDPMVSDGVTRRFRVVGTALMDGGTRVFVRNVNTVDPDPSSSTYNQTYKPFELIKVGSSKALTINLITTQRVGSKTHFARMKTSLIIRNIK